MSMSSVMFEYCSSMSLQVMQQATRTSLSINPIIHLILVYVWIALKTAEVCVCFFFFCVGPVHCLRDPQVWISTNFSLKLGLMTLFTYLKIILLQYF